MIDWKERYMREVEGLNNEGDPIGGDPPSGLRHQVEALKAENEAQAKRILDLEEHVTKLGSGSRQHLYQAFARRYREILSLRRENEALRKQVEILLGAAQKTVLALAHASIHDPLYAQAYDELSESINLASKNGDSK